MIAGLVALRMIVPAGDSLVSLGIGFGVGAVLYVGSCLLLPRGRAEVRSLFTDLAASFPATLLWGWKRDPR
jgi:hypothetical protein